MYKKGCSMELLNEMCPITNISLGASHTHLYPLFCKGLLQTKVLVLCSCGKSVQHLKIEIKLYTFMNKKKQSNYKASFH